MRLLLYPVLLFTYWLTAFGVPAAPPTLLVVGDSLSAAYGINTDEGWVALLQERLNEKGLAYHVVNASVSGDTTRTGLNRLGPALAHHQPAIVIIALGGNDGLRGLPFSEIETSLSTMIEMCQQQQIKVLLVGVRLPPNYGAYYNNRFARLFDKLANTYQVALAPQLMANVAEHGELMQADGIHPTAAAQPRMLDNVWPQLLPLLNTQQAIH